MPSAKAISTDKSRAYSNSGSFNVTVLISGSGTNLQALIDACGQSPASKTKPRLLPQAEITHVISNRKDAYGLTRARDANIATTYHNLVSYKNKYPKTENGEIEARRQYDADLAQMILTHIPCPDLVICAGWMHILSPVFINALTAANVPIINLHPALPKQFNGANAIGEAYKAFQRGQITHTGVMVHQVVEEVDMGEPILVQKVECRSGESQEDLERRIHETEWRLLVEATGEVLNKLEEKRRLEH